MVLAHLTLESKLTPAKSGGSPKRRLPSFSAFLLERECVASLELLFQTVSESSVIFWVMIVFVWGAVGTEPGPGPAGIDAQLPNSRSRHEKAEWELTGWAQPSSAGRA